MSDDGKPRIPRGPNALRRAATRAKSLDAARRSLAERYPAFAASVEAEHRAVMLFDNDTRQEINPRAEIRADWDANAPGARA